MRCVVSVRGTGWEIRSAKNGERDGGNLSGGMGDNDSGRSQSARDNGSRRCNNGNGWW